MNIAIVFDWFARDSLRAAEETNDPRQREIFVKLPVLWASAARPSRDEASTTQAAQASPCREVRALGPSSQR
jgi:hypothetical protein